MSAAPLRIVVLGLSLSSSWGNGHATTYRALLAAMTARGHDVLFLERDTPWYAGNRDLAHPHFCRFALYTELDDLERFAPEIANADAVIVGSFVPDGIAVGQLVQELARGVTAFYDIDTPLTLARLDQNRCDYLSRALVPGYDLYLSFSAGPILKQLVERFGAPAAMPLFCSVDAERYQPLDLPARWDLGYLGTYSDDRQATLDWLLLEPARCAPHLRFVVAGPQYPAGIRWPDNVDRLQHVAPADHPAFYAGCRYTLNVTRADMISAGYSPSVRLFEAAACATPIISDAWPGQEEFLVPDREIILPDGPDAVLAVLAWPESRRRAVADAARRKVLAAHTAAARAGELEDALNGALARSRRAVPPALRQEAAR